MQSAINFYEGEIILNEQNLKELYTYYQPQVEKKFMETICLTDYDKNQNESEDEIISIEVNPLFLNKNEKLEDLNILTKKNYRKILREIKRKKQKKPKVVIDLIEEEKKMPSNILPFLKKKKKRENKITIQKNVINKEINKTVIATTNLKLKIPEFFDKSNRKKMFLSTKNDLKNSLQNPDLIFSILSFNILSQQFIKKVKVKKGLILSNRMKTILDQLKLISSDIICLQEVDFKALNHHIIPSMKNYSFYFAQTYGSFFSNVIGFKSDKFKVIERENLNLKHINIKSNRGVFKMLLEVKGISKTRIVVYNIHLPWKLKYIYHKCEILALIAADVMKTGINNVILAGDFNSTPDSMVLKLLYDKIFIEENLKSIKNMDSISAMDNNQIISTKSYNSLNNRKFNQMRETEFNSYDGGDPREEKPDEDQKRKIENDSEMYKTFRNLLCDFNFKSSYQDYKILISPESVNLNIPLKLKFEKCHPEFTYFTENFRNTIDYIFYSSKTLELRNLLKIPSREQVSSEGFLPSTKYPSDHLIIFAEFNLKNK